MTGVRVLSGILSLGGSCIQWESGGMPPKDLGHLRLQSEGSNHPTTAKNNFQGNWSV